MSCATEVSAGAELSVVDASSGGEALSVGVVLSVDKVRSGAA